MSELILGSEVQFELEGKVPSHDRKLLDQLLIDSQMYQTSKEFKELLDFTVRLRNMAPFNALLLQIQKPGLQYAASAQDWKNRFDRSVKHKARPLLILWPFGPVALVYDLLDTEGKDLPKDAFAFYAKGKIDCVRIENFLKILTKKKIHASYYDQGDSDAGYIRRQHSLEDNKKDSSYELGLNLNHDASMTFVTLTHELGHLFLGHLGDDSRLGIQKRETEHRIREIEAESTAYIVCQRNGVECRSQKYLSEYVAKEETSLNLDLYAITRAAGRIEQLLQLNESCQWRPNPKGEQSLFDELDVLP